MAEIQAPARIGHRFEVIQELGRGSSSTVYLVRDSSEGRVLALKLLHEELVHAVGADRFEREIRVLAGLRHPNILPMLEVGRDGDRPFFTMPFVKGWTLRQRLGKGGQLPVDETLRIARQLCAALAFAHERDVLHRDIKPENVLGAGESVYLMDFGIARALDEGAELSLTSSGLSLGTPAYMSPEQVCADRTLDARSDQYSLALVLYECLAGRSAFGGINAQAIAAVRLVSDPTPLELHRPDLPPSVARAIARALAREPEARFPHIESFERSLHDIS